MQPYTVRSLKIPVDVTDEEKGILHYRENAERWGVFPKDTEVPVVSTQSFAAARGIGFMLNSMTEEEAKEALRAIGVSAVKDLLRSYAVFGRTAQPNQNAPA